MDRFFGEQGHHGAALGACPLTAVVTVVNRKDGDKVVRLLHDAISPFQVTCLAQGTMGSEWMDLLGFGSVDKAIDMCVVPAADAGRVMACLSDGAKLHKAGKGIAFTIPVTGIGVAAGKLVRGLAMERAGGLSAHTRIAGDYSNGGVGANPGSGSDARYEGEACMNHNSHSGAHNGHPGHPGHSVGHPGHPGHSGHASHVGGHGSHVVSHGGAGRHGAGGTGATDVPCPESHALWDSGHEYRHDTPYTLIAAVVNRGTSEELSELARSVGARGGTVVNALRTGIDQDRRLFGRNIELEKEIVFIIAKQEIRQELVEELTRSFGLRTDAQGIIFTLPVESVAGIK